jgi:hypothetical protein
MEIIKDKMINDFKDKLSIISSKPSNIIHQLKGIK